MLAGPARAASDGVLEGSVRSTDGLALPHVRVLVEGPSGPLQVTTDPEGSFRATGLAPGAYTASVDAPGFVLDGAAPATVAEGGVAARLDLALSPAPVREEVLVTAARGEATHSNLGVSTTLIDRERIEERAAPSLLSLLQEVPGTATARTGTTGMQGSVFLRGGESRYAAVLVDGMPVNQPGGAFDWSGALPFEMERIEVVRGAASSLYGNDALAGVIQLVTRRAREGDPPSLRGEAEAGSFDWQRYQVATTGARRGFDWNLGVQRLTTDNAEPNSRYQQTAFATSLGFRLGPRTEGRAVVRYDEGDVGTAGPTAFVGPDLDASFERKDTVVSTSVRHTAGRAAHLFSLGYTSTDQLSLNPVDSGCDTPGWEGQTGAFPICDFPNPDGFQNQTSRLFAGYQADLSLGTRHLVSAGVDGAYETGALGNRAEELLRPDQANVGVYVQDRVLVGQRAYLTVGGRVERNGVYGTKAVPRAALALRLREGEDATTLRTSAGMGIKAPSFLESYGESFFAKGNPDLDPEESRTIDLGLDQRLFGSRLRAVVTAFFQDYRNQIAYTVVDFDTFEGTYVNLGRTRARGIEVELDARPRPWLALLGQYTYTDSEILESANDFSPIYAVGESLLRRPRNQASVSATPRVPPVECGGNRRLRGRARGQRLRGTRPDPQRGLHPPRRQGARPHRGTPRGLAGRREPDRRHLPGGARLPRARPVGARRPAPDRGRGRPMSDGEQAEAALHPQSDTTRLLVLLTLLLGLGCAREHPATAEAEGPRIVVMAPAAAEVLETLGRTDRVVGRGDFVVWPPAMQALPRVGAYHAPSVETILALKTTLLLTTASQAAQGAHRKLQDLGIEVLAVETNTYDRMLAAIVAIGREVGREAEAARVVERIRREMDEIRALARDAPRRRVVFVVDRDPVYVAGPGSHVDEMIRAVGGENIASDAASDWQLVSMEVVFERAPEVIIDTSENGDGALRGRRPGPWDRWPFLPAVRENRVYWVDPTRLAIPGPRLPEMTRLMGRLIQPEIFGEPSATDFETLEGADRAPR